MDIVEESWSTKLQTLHLNNLSQIRLLSIQFLFSLEKFWSFQTNIAKYLRTSGIIFETIIIIIIFLLLLLLLFNVCKGQMNVLEAMPFLLFSQLACKGLIIPISQVRKID